MGTLCVHISTMRVNFLLCVVVAYYMLGSVMNPDPVGSGTCSWIRNYFLRIRIQANNQIVFLFGFNCTENKVECSGSFKVIVSTWLILVFE